MEIDTKKKKKKKKNVFKMISLFFHSEILEWKLKQNQEALGHGSLTWVK